MPGAVLQSRFLYGSGLGSVLGLMVLTTREIFEKLHSTGGCCLLQELKGHLQRQKQTFSESIPSGRKSSASVHTSSLKAIQWWVFGFFPPSPGKRP